MVKQYRWFYAPSSDRPRPPPPTFPPIARRACLFHRRTFLLSLVPPDDADADVARARIFSYLPARSSKRVLTTRVYSLPKRNLTNSFKFIHRTPSVTMVTGHGKRIQTSSFPWSPRVFFLTRHVFRCGTRTRYCSKTFAYDCVIHGTLNKMCKMCW